MAVIDDDAMARTGLAMIVSSAPDVEVVAQADDGDQAVTLVAAHHPDVLLLDIQMARMSGLDAARQVCRQPGAPRVIMITSFNLDAYVFEALTAGATGFLLKEASPQEIIEAVRVAVRGDAMLSPKATTHLINHVVTRSVDPERRRARSRVELLSDRERQVITEVAQGRSNAEIAGRLYLSEATIKTHLTRMFTKLDLSNRVQLAIFAHRAGLVDW